MGVKPRERKQPGSMGERERAIFSRRARPAALFLDASATRREERERKEGVEIWSGGERGRKGCVTLLLLLSGFERRGGGGGGFRKDKAG